MSGKRGLIDANSKPSSCIMKKSRQPCPSNNKPQPQSGNGSPEMQLSFESNNSLLLPHAPDSMDTYQTPANGENVEMCTDNRDDDHVGSSHSGPAEILRSIAHEMTIIPLKIQGQSSELTDATQVLFFKPFNQSPISLTSTAMSLPPAPIVDYSSKYFKAQTHALDSTLLRAKQNLEFAKKRVEHLERMAEHDRQELDWAESNRPGCFPEIVNESLKCIKQQVDMSEKALATAKKELDYAKKCVESTEKFTENMRRKFTQTEEEMKEILEKFQHDEQVTNTHIEMVQPIEGKD